MKHKDWFTIIELLVVITLISILWTIWYISYSWYISESRDANRVSQVSSIYKALETYRIKWFLPLPDWKVTVLASWSIIWYQWYMWEDALNKIWYQDGWKDQKDNEYFTYYLSKDLRKAELMIFLEDEVEISYNIINKANANDYTDRIPKVYWSKLWILTESGTNTPIQEIDNIISSGFLDIVKTTSSFTAYISDDYKVSWTGSVLAFLKDWAWKSCKDLLNIDSSKMWQDWVYYINPTWTWSFQVYCDMTNDWGWWTLVTNIQSSLMITSTLYDTWYWIPNLSNIWNWAWIISAGLYDSIGQIIRINMWTVRDYFKPKTWYTLKNMVMSSDKHTWSNSADWVFVTPGYLLWYPTVLWWSVLDWPKNNIWDSRNRLSFWWWWSISYMAWCCHNSISTPGPVTRGRIFSMWVR